MRHKPDLDFDPVRYREPLLSILESITGQPGLTRKRLERVLKIHAKTTGHFFRNDELILAYRTFAGTAGLPPFDPAVLEVLRLKPIRSTSGVAVVTVLTKPYPCPGECIFCPNDVRMPKSYLSDEPGAQRAAQNAFDPYLQTYTRLQALDNIGHPTDKIEVIILGGTWSFYPETYQIWFVKRVFDALHDFGNGVDRTSEVWGALEKVSQLSPGHEPPEVHIDGGRLEQNYNQVVQTIYLEEMRRSREQADAVASGALARSVTTEYATWEELEAAHRENETADCRCVGLVVETRPDYISSEEVVRVRRLGCTKVQLGIQSLHDKILYRNKRGHDTAATRRAIKLLRQAGFKIHAHWMPNLYGSTPEVDLEDYRRLFDDPAIRPDELKIYPCSLIQSAELMQHYQDGTWRPYTHDELLSLLVECFCITPEYCRLTRVIRDIPGTDIVAGNTTTNFRQIVDDELARRGEQSRDIRAREIRKRDVTPEELHLDEIAYASDVGEEIFMQFVTAERQIAGFLRLSLPSVPPLIDELRDAAMIREVHVYGQALGIGETAPGKSQHLGLGTQLIERALEIARAHGYKRLAVISAIGTREYYRQRGFVDGDLYQTRELSLT